MTEKKAIWETPNLTALDVTKTMTGPIPLDTEATFQGVDQQIGGPQS